MKQPWKPNDAPDVLRNKLQEAHELVQWYEQKIQELYMAAHSSVINQSSAAELRRAVEAVLTAICSRGHSSSLIRDDREHVLKTLLGDRFLRQCDQTMNECAERWASLDTISQASPGSRQECLAILDVVRLNCEVFKLGLEPVRIVRDAYAAALNKLVPSTPKAGKRGRKKNPQLEIRDDQIRQRFSEMSGKHAERKRILAEKYTISEDYVGRIVRRTDVSRPGKK